MNDETPTLDKKFNCMVSQTFNFMTHVELIIMRREFLTSCLPY
jgi:hypothetical protein